MKLTRFRIFFNNVEIIVHEVRRKNVLLSILGENDIDYKIIEEEYEV